MKKNIISLVVVALIILATVVVPAPAGLDAAGLRGLGLLLATIVLYVTGALPLVVTTLLAMALMPILGIMPFSDVWPAFGNSAVFFMLASFGVSAAMGNTNIPQIITRAILHWSRGKSRRLCFGFMGAAALVSSLMSDIPTCVMFSALALDLLRAAGEDSPGKSRLGRALMIAVPVGSIIGGFATPAGNGLNIMVMGAVESVGGVSLSFAQWAAAGIPLAIVMVVFCSFWLHTCCKPQDLDVTVIERVREELAPAARITSVDVRFLVVLSLMVAFWVASSWVSAINVTQVSIIGVVVMHLPGIQLLQGKDFVKGVSWETFVMCGGIIALGTGVQSTGAITWLVDMALSGVELWPLICVLAVLSLIACVVHLCTPVAGAIYALTCVPLVTAAVVLGIDPRVVGLIVGVWICSTFMQPLDLVYLLTYSHGYYTMGQLARFGVLPTVLLLVLTVTWIPALCSIM